MGGLTGGFVGVAVGTYVAVGVCVATWVAVGVTVGGGVSVGSGVWVGVADGDACDMSVVGVGVGVGVGSTVVPGDAGVFADVSFVSPPTVSPATRIAGMNSLCPSA